MSDLNFMRRALALARRGFGRTSPNPMVGAVLVNEGKTVGEGYHLYEPRHHAETLALQQAGSRVRGATLYINLEPCSHHGRTPPCAERLVEAGVRRVFVAIRDPNPKVSGKGIEILRQAGIEVEEGLCAEEAAQLNEAFLHSVRTGRPFATLKLAMTLDGRIATRSGDSQWITGPQARRRVHRLRYGSDAILVGSETVLRDDPSLDVRWARRNRILKVVLDSRLRTPAQARIFASGDPVLIFHADDLPQSRPRPYPDDIELAAVPHRSGVLDWQEILAQLDRRRVRSLMVEGGRMVAASALKAGAVQKVEFYYGPRIIGGDGLAAIGQMGFNLLHESLHLDRLRLHRLGPDFLVEGYLKAG